MIHTYNMKKHYSIWEVIPVITGLAGRISAVVIWVMLQFSSHLNWPEVTLFGWVTFFTVALAGTCVRLNTCALIFPVSHTEMKSLHPKHPRAWGYMQTFPDCPTSLGLFVYVLGAPLRFMINQTNHTPLPLPSFYPGYILTLLLYVINYPVGGLLIRLNRR